MKMKKMNSGDFQLWSFQMYFSFKNFSHFFPYICSYHNFVSSFLHLIIFICLLPFSKFEVNFYVILLIYKAMQFPYILTNLCINYFHLDYNFTIFYLLTSFQLSWPKYPIFFISAPFCSFFSYPPTPKSPTKMSSFSSSTLTTKIMMVRSHGKSFAITSNSSNPITSSPLTYLTLHSTPSMWMETGRSSWMNSSICQRWKSSTNLAINKSTWDSLKTKTKCKSCGFQILKNTCNQQYFMVNTQQN